MLISLQSSSEVLRVQQSYCECQNPNSASGEALVSHCRPLLHGALAPGAQRWGDRRGLGTPGSGPVPPVLQ